MNTLTEVAEKCYNYIELVGTLTEWDVDVYEKNDTIVIKYIGVVDCDNAYINIKGVLTQYDDLCKGFIDEFKDEAPPNQRVFVRGKLNAQGGVTVGYISKTYGGNKFEGYVHGIPIAEDKVLIVDKDYHQIIPLPLLNWGNNTIHEYKLSSNPLVINNEDIILNDGIPAIIIDDKYEHKDIIPQHLIDQALEEHEIYLESMEQKTSG